MAQSENQPGGFFYIRVFQVTTFTYITEEGKNARWLLSTGDQMLKRTNMLRVQVCQLWLSCYLDSGEILKRLEYKPLASKGIYGLTNRLRLTLISPSANLAAVIDARYPIRFHHLVDAS